MNKTQPGIGMHPDFFEGWDVNNPWIRASGFRTKSKSNEDKKTSSSEEEEE